MIRVLHVLAGLNRGGVETWLLQLLKKVDRQRFHIDILVASCVGDYAEAVRELGSNVISAAPASDLLRFGATFRKALRTHGPYQVVHSHVWFASGNVMRLSRKNGIPVRIVHSRTTNGAIEKNVTRRAYELVMRWQISQHATHIAAITQDAGNALYGDSIWRSRGYIIPTAIDVDPFIDESTPVLKKHDLGIPEDSIIIGHVGSFIEQKNHSLLVDIVGQLISRQDNVYLLMVGEGPLRGRIKRRVQEMGIEKRVLMLGGIDNVPSILLGCTDIVVFPSLWEGMGRVIVEAQAAGVPVVMSDIVPEEADVVPGLTTRVGLDCSAKVWADKILDVSRRPLPISQKKAADIVLKSSLSMDQTALELQRLYEIAVKDSVEA